MTRAPSSHTSSSSSISIFLPPSLLTPNTDAHPHTAAMLARRRISSYRQQRQNSTTYQPPSPRTNEPTPKKPNPHGLWYRTFGRPVAKNFLIALFTYQVLYWGWLKMESVEVKKEKESEVRGLEGELKEVVGRGKVGG